MAEINKNLRVLAQAYSNGKLTKDQYDALRSKQLSAIEFGKPFPPMPPGLSSVNVPNVKIEAPSDGKNKKPILIIVAVLLVLLIGAAAFIAMQSGDKDAAAGQANVDHSIAAQAQRLTPTSSTQQIKQFTNNWKALGEQQQKLHRKATWFAPLQTDITQSIKALQQGDDAQDKPKLGALKLLNRLLTPAPAGIQPETMSSKPVINTEVVQEPLLDESLTSPEAPAIIEAVVQPAAEPTPEPLIAPVTETPTTPVVEAEPVPVAEPAVVTPAIPDTAPLVESAPRPEAVATPAIDQPVLSAPAVTPEPVTPEPVAPAVEATPAVTPPPAAPEPVSIPTPKAEPAPTTQGFDLNPEYEREQEFGKSARDALFNDTPEY